MGLTARSEHSEGSALRASHGTAPRVRPVQPAPTLVPKSPWDEVMTTKDHPLQVHRALLLAQGERRGHNPRRGLEPASKALILRTGACWMRGPGPMEDGMVIAHRGCPPGWARAPGQAGRATSAGAPGPPTQGPETTGRRQLWPSSNPGPGPVPLPSQQPKPLSIQPRPQVPGSGQPGIQAQKLCWEMAEGLLLAKASGQHSVDLAEESPPAMAGSGLPAQGAQHPAAQSPCPQTSRKHGSPILSHYGSLGTLQQVQGGAARCSRSCQGPDTQWQASDPQLLENPGVWFPQVWLGTHQALWHCLGCRVCPANLPPCQHQTKNPCQGLHLLPHCPGRFGPPWGQREALEDESLMGRDTAAHGGHRSSSGLGLTGPASTQPSRWPRGWSCLPRAGSPQCVSQGQPHGNSPM